MATRKFMWMLLVASIVAAPALAQPGSEDLVDRRLEMLDERLDLTDAQKNEIRQIWSAHRAAMKAWSAQNQNVTRDERREYFRSRADEVHGAVREVLTPEQAKNLDAFRQARLDRMRDGRRGPGMRGDRPGRRSGDAMRGRRGMGRSGGGAGMASWPGFNIERLADELDLSQAQREEMLEIIEVHRADGMAWRDANPNATPDEMLVYHEGHFAQLKAELEQVLTPEQIERFSELHETRRDNMRKQRMKN